VSTNVEQQQLKAKTLRMAGRQQQEEIDGNAAF
jgi:hypothetical protein